MGFFKALPELAYVIMIFPILRLLDRYAHLVVKVGINIQLGQTLIVFASLSSADFVRRIARKAYESGAKNVYVDWSDDDLTRIKYDLARRV